MGGKGVYVRAVDLVGLSAEEGRARDGFLEIPSSAQRTRRPVEVVSLLHRHRNRRRDAI
jgi:hypothetical protein